MKKKLFKACTYGISTICMTTLLSGCQSAQNIAISPLTATVGFINSTIGTPNNEKTLLHEVCRADYVVDDLNLKILASFTDIVNQVHCDGETPLHAAIKTGKPHHFIEILLNAGADPNIVDDYGHNALHFAILSHYEPKTIQLLIDAGADVNIGSPFQLAIKNNSSDEVFELLIKSGVDVSSTMWTILEVPHWKSLCERLPAELINSVAQYPINYNDYLIEETNMSAFKDMTDELSLIDIAVIRADCEQYEYFNSKGFNLSKKIRDQYAILQFPVEKGETKLTELLIQSGHDINLIDRSGTSPLHTAAKTGNEKICKLLINYGADVNLKDSRGDSPLHLAIKAKSVKSAILLLERGALPDQVNSEGESPMELSINHDLEFLMPYLLNKSQNQKNVGMSL